MRRATILGAAAVAIACGGGTTPGDAGNDAASDAADFDSMATFYGGPPIDASPGDAAPADATTDQDSGGIALYGAPPFDSGNG
jgi:hypothetical protein